MRIIEPSKQQVPPDSKTEVKGKPDDVQTIKGLVTSIIDGNTFEISVNDHGQDKRLEVIRIHGMNQPSPSTLSGILAKLELEKKIVGRTLECEIIEKDDLDQLIAKIPSKYLQQRYPIPSARN